MIYKRLFFCLISIAFSILVFGQNQEGVVGHWKFCDEEWGYYECLIGDSTLDWLSPTAFNMVGLSFKSSVSNNTIVYSDGYSEDSLTFQITDADNIILIDQKRTYHLERMKEDVLNFYSYDCSFKMSYFDFVKLLEEQLRDRMKLNDAFCPRLERENRTDLGVYDDDLMEEEVLDNATSPVAVKAFGYLNCSKILETTINDDFENKIVSTQYNADSTAATLVFDALQYCYASHHTRVSLDDRSALEIMFRKNNPICKEKCIMRFEMEMQLRNYLIDEVIFINE